MLNIAHYQRNANQNYNKVITSHGSEWPSTKSLQTINAGGGVEKREPLALLVGIQIDMTTVQDSMEIDRKSVV